MNPDASFLTAFIQAACAPVAPQPSVSAPQWKILVVDDDVPTQRLECLVLSRAGYATETAADGEQAWAHLLAGHFDLLLTDHNMPRLCGLDLVRRMRAAGMSLPVIINSGGLDHAEALDYEQLNVAAVLNKARGFPELMSLVKLLLPLPPKTESQAVPGVGMPPVATPFVPQPSSRHLAARAVPKRL